MRNTDFEDTSETLNLDSRAPSPTGDYTFESQADISIDMANLVCTYLLLLFYLIFEI
jgi:hypothetical protein